MQRFNHIIEETLRSTGYPTRDLRCKVSNPAGIARYFAAEHCKQRLSSVIWGYLGPFGKMNELPALLSDDSKASRMCISTLCIVWNAPQMSNWYCSRCPQALGNIVQSLTEVVDKSLNCRYPII